MATEDHRWKKGGNQPPHQRLGLALSRSARTTAAAPAAKRRVMAGDWLRRRQGAVWPLAQEEDGASVMDLQERRKICRLGQELMRNGHGAHRFPPDRSAPQRTRKPDDRRHRPPTQRLVVAAAPGAVKPASLANLHSTITSFANRHGAARRPQQGKRYRPAVLALTSPGGRNFSRQSTSCRASPTPPAPIASSRSSSPNSA